MTSKSKAKGNRFEYEIRDMLNKIYDSGEFARTPGSGAIMGRGNFVKRQGLSEDVQNTLSSDLICPDWFPFAIEAKNYADSPIYHSLIGGQDLKLNHWLGETCFDAKNFNKIPLLFFKTTRKGSFVAMPYDFAVTATNGALPKQFLKYDEFIVMGVDYFIEHKEDFRNCTQNVPAVSEWLSSSVQVTTLLQYIDDVASKKKKKKV